MIRSLYAASMLAVSLFGLWLLLSGHFSTLFLSLGAASAGFIVYLEYRRRRRFTQQTPRFRPKFLSAMKFFADLLFDILRANLHIARVIWSPAMRIAPRVIKIPAQQKSEVGEAVFANSITLTPGTVSIETGDDHIIVHALTEKSADPAALAELHRRVLALENQKA